MSVVASLSKRIFWCGLMACLALGSAEVQAAQRVVTADGAVTEMCGRHSGVKTRYRHCNRRGRALPDAGAIGNGGGHGTTSS